MPTRQLYLVRHAKAVSTDIDSQKPLSEQGCEDIGKVADFIKPLGLGVDYLWHSGKLRAEQTAEVLSEVVEVKIEVAAHSFLAPNDEVAPIKDEIELAEQDVMIVGHLPFMGKLASLLLAGDEYAGVAAFRAGGIMCLESDDRGKWLLDWMVIPQIVPSD